LKSFTPPKKVDEKDDVQDADASFMHDVEWNKLVSSGRKHFLVCCNDKDWAVKVTLLAVLLEGTRQLHRYYEKAANMSQTKARSTYPPVIQVMNERASLIVAVLQYYSALIGTPSSCPRLYLVFAHRGCQSFSEWKKLYPGDVEQLSNAVLMLTASLERRQRQLWTSKYDCLRLGDLRYTPSDRLAIAELLVRTPECCLRHGLQRGLRAWALRQSADLALAAQTLVNAQPIILRIAWFVKLSIANVESLHKLHREIVRGSTGQMAVSLMCAASVNMRAQKRFEERSKEELDADDPLQALPPSTPSSSASLGVVLGQYDSVRRRLKPSEVHKKRKFDEIKSRGEKCPDPVLPSTKKWLADEWERCDLQEAIICQDLSDLTYIIALQNRSSGMADPAAAIALPTLESSAVVLFQESIEVPSKIPVHDAVCCPKTLRDLGPSASMGICLQDAAQSADLEHQFCKSVYRAFRTGQG